MSERSDPPSNAAAHIGALRRALGLAEWTVRPVGVNRYGDQILIFGDAAYVALGGPSATYGGMAFSAQDLANVLRDLRDAEDVRALCLRLAQDATNHYLGLAIRASDMVSQTIQATTMTLANPAVPAAQKGETAAAAERLLGLHDSRNASRAAAIQATKAKKAEDLQRDRDLSRLSLEKRFLEGEELRPGDLLSQPAPARSSRRRAPRTRRR